MASSERAGQATRLLRLASELARERRALERVMGEAREALATFATRAPTSLEIRGTGDLLHDFYTGAEKSFELVATTVDGGAPEGAAWHRRLLESMGDAIADTRPALLRPETAAALVATRLLWRAALRRYTSAGG